MPGWVLVPNPGNLVQAPPSLPPVCRVGTTLRSTPTPGLWATVWPPLRTRCSDVVRSFSQRQPTRHDRDFQRPPPGLTPPWPWCWMGPALSFGPGHPPRITCCKARVCAATAPRPAPGGLAPPCTPMAPATAAACTSEQNGFCLHWRRWVRVSVRDSPPCLPVPVGVQGSGEGVYL